MRVRTVKTIIVLTLVLACIMMAGCLSSPGDRSPTAGGSTPTPVPLASTPPKPSAVTPTPGPGGSVPTPGTTIIPGGAVGPGTPGAGDDSGGQPGTNGTNRSTVTPAPSPTPVPVVSGHADNWGTSKDSYARGETATGYVYVTNTGNVPITQIDFTIVIKNTILFFPIEKSYSYSKTGLSIQPGKTERVEFSQPIPSEYEGISTAGNYQFTVTALLAGKSIGPSFTKSIAIT